MDQQERSLQEIYHIKKMMERSSRFSSLSGVGAILAGVFALAGCWLAAKKIECWQRGDCAGQGNGISEMLNYLLLIAGLTLAAALISTFIFTYLRLKKTGSPLWSSITIRIFWNIAIPFLAGGFFLIRVLQLGEFELVAPVCLLFYGVALVNCAKYTLSEVRYLGYAEILIGIISLWLPSYGLYFWAAGFGLFHIVYGILIWFWHERTVMNETTISA